MNKPEKQKLFIKLMITTIIIGILLGVIVAIAGDLSTSIIIIFIFGVLTYILWIFVMRNTETTKEKIERQNKEKKENITNQLPKVKYTYDYCLTYKPNIDDFDYNSYTESINEKFCVEEWNYYGDENRYIILDNFSIHKRGAFSIWYSKIQNLNIDIFTSNDDYSQVCQINFYIFYTGSVYYEDIDNCKWEDTCAIISFDYKHLNDAKRFCEIIKTILALNQRATQ